MPWPLSQDYNEAIQSPATNFADADLQTGKPAVNALGLPMPYSGTFADVYQMRGPDGARWAVSASPAKSPACASATRRSAIISARPGCPSPWISPISNRAFACWGAGIPR